MTKQINTLTVATLRAAADFQTRVATLREALPTATLADAKACADALRPGVAQYYGITLSVAATGRTAFPADHADAQTARQALSRLVRAVIGSEGAKREEVEVPAELLKAAAKLAKLAQQYEGSRSLASKALAAAFAK
jgi:hypothetical protein